MGCVAKSTKEFKDLATRNNVDSNILELIIHKYWLETGNELHFPTDLYIQSQLGMGVYKESGKSVRKLWELKYNTPKKYNSLQEVKVAVAEAGKYFPASAIYFHKNADGKYTLTVKRPVEHIDNSKDSFFQEYDGGTSIKNARKLSLGIEEGRVYSLDKVQELYNKFNTDRTSQALADRAFNVARELGLQITFDESLPFGITGRYSNDNTLRFKKYFLERDMMNSKKAPIILHEVLHALSMYALSNQTKNWKRGEALEGFRTEMNSLYQDLKNNPILKDERGITDLHEFVAELANPVFREKIKNIDRDVAAEKTLEKKSFWRRIVDAFKNLLGLQTTNTYYQRSMNALEKALDAFDIDTYMRYNGVKNFLRQGYNAKEWEFNATSDKEIKTQVEDYVNNLPDTQLNETFNVINKAKESGKWTPEALKTLDNLITDIENGKVTYQRFPQEASRASYQGGRANEAASILLSTNESSDSRNPRAVRERYERDKREQPIQERIVEAWAKAKGIWHDNLDTIEGKEQIGKGGEAKVFANDGDINVTKILSTEYFVTPQFALDRITLHNTLFPEAPLKVLGFGRNSKGEFQFLVEQPFIQGKHATKKEIHDFISKMGFTKTDKDRGNTFISDDLYLSDLHDENVIKTANNTLVVIDADLRLNTPELNRNGKYKINNAITSTQEVYKKTFIRTLSGKQLKQELATIKQENADYNLLHNIKPEQKHSDKAVPQDFTFADGTKVQAPFKPNAQQVEALNAIDDFIKSKETSMTLSGYAGTGKTSIMEMIAQKVQKQGKRVVFCASTNKAAAVLQNRVSKAGFEASTLNKVFGISVEVKQSNSHYDAQDLETVLKEANIERGTTVFIDEASMINEKNYHILNDIADKEGLKLIYVGDAAQLAPIGETKVSKVFRNGDGKVVTLTQVERTGDNAILREATDIRNGKPLSKESSFNSKGEGVAYISPMHQDAINEVIQTYIKGLKQNPDFFRILAYSNKAVADYNNQVRELLGYTSALPEVGEPMVGYANWGYDWKDKSYKFINSEAYKVVSVHKPKTVVCHLFDGTPITMEALPITLQDSWGHKNTFRYMDITHNSKNRENAMRLAKEKARLWVDVKRAPKGTKKNYYAKINEIEEFLFVNDDLKDGKYTLQSKVIDFGYAMTIHKSQGSTFTHVLMDDVDITKYTGNNSFEEISSIDLGDDTSVDFSNAEMIEESPVDLGNLEEADTAPVIPETVDERQQLEYVGVSRATDTVTVISNGVKKEGSPLHPEKAIKEDKSRYSNKNQNNGKEEYKPTDEFRRVQEAVRGSGEQSNKASTVFEGDLTRDQRQRLANVLGRQLGSINSFIHGSSRDVSNTKHGTTFKIHTEVNPQLFHDIFEVVRYYTPNGELVDLHEDYSNCKCFLTEDGTAGFAVEPDGNLVSVFNLGTARGFLGALRDLVREAGATHLDAYASKEQNLELMYEKTLGFHTASTMDYNMEYDHDNIAKNHGNPQVVFMVDHEITEPKHFDKDSYDEAQQYQLEQLKSTKEEASSEVKDNTQDSTIVENLVENGEEPQQISLPNYENIKGYYNATPVDAAWKIPYLQELDEKLDTLGAMEENQPVVEEMDRLLQATTEKEYKATQKDKTKTEVDSIIAQYDKLNKHIDKLLDNQHGLKASEVRHCATQIADAISDDINSLQKIPNLAEQWFPALNTDLNFQTASRKQIVTTVGIDALIQRARERFSSAYYDDVDTILQMDLIVENWDALMTFATDSFAFNEGFGIKKNYKTGRYELTSQSKIDVDNFQDYSNDPDVAEETGAKDSQEYWQVESKTVAVINSMSALVKQGLHECYLVDAEGNKILSKWGIPERVNPREATNSILRWARGSKSLSDMVAKMSAKQQQHPWLAQLITRLSDKSGKETDFQSQFFNVFSKDHQLYSIVLMEDGMYHSMLANRNSTLSDAMQSISAQFTIGEHPLFTGSKVKSDALGSSTTTNKDAAFSLHKAHTELSILNDRLKKEELSTELMQEASANIAGVCRLLGFNADEKALKEAINKESLSDMTYSLGWIIKNLDAVRQSQLRGENKDYNPFKFKGDNSIDGHVRNFLAPIAEVMQDSGNNAFYDSGKMYQSYITPSFMTRLMNTFHQEDTEAFKDFMLNEYGSSEFFKTKTKGPLYDKMGWRNEWMNRMYNDKQMRHIIDHKVELNFNKHNYMRNMTDTEYTLSVLAEYLSEPAVDGVDVAWFRVPIQSNKPSSDFIRFYAYKDMSNYKESILSGLHSIYLQELDRISTVKARNLSKGDPAYINNFDEVGRSFCFLPVLNDYLEDSTAAKAKRNILTDKEGNISADNEKLAQLLQKKLEGKKALTEDEEVKLSQLIDDVLRQHMENRTANIIERWEKEGIIEAAKKVQGLGKEDADVKKVLENFIWNDAYASKIILQLTIGDIAFYENTENLQKRLSQLHSPGTRANVEATDYKGNRVSDGKYRTVILNDFDSFKSNIIDNINEVFERKIKAANDENSKAVLRSLKDSLTAPRVVDAKTGKVIEKGGSFWNINVTDAQGFSSPSSYRKKAFMFGKWSNNSERIYNLLKQNKANLTDLQTAFQPMKPFVFSVLHKNMNAANAPITSMPVPFQAKNSEYLLIMADALLQGEELGRPNLLRAIYRVMEESEKRNPTKGIDTVQFESAIKSGLQGTIDIAQFRESTTGEEDAYNLMMKSIYKEGTSDYNTDVFVQETTYDHYCMQQEVPAHFKNHTQAHGSQIRMIIPSDLDLYTTDESGAMVTNYYEWTEPDGTKRKVTADEFKKEYERTIADSIDESIINLSKELHLDSDNIKERNIALSKILQNEIVSSPRYGIDLLQACSIDLETGEFRIPKGDPIQAKRIEQLINSIIKNRINKQEIAGGPIVQVSNFGTSKQLHIRFNDKQGNLIPLREEYKPAEHDGLSYEKFLEKHQGGIAYFEVYVPIWSEELVEKFGKPDGSIDVDLIEQIDPELLKMVSYRIPTEDKYSCAPMKVVGFMPREAGDAIMFPYELTEIDDSDFDVDKRYVMRKDIPILTRPRKEIEDKLFKKASESYAKAHEGHSNNTMIRNQVKMFLDNPQKMKDVDTLMQSLWQEYRKVAYYTEAPVSGKKYRDNKIVDMSYAVLTNQMTADKILNPGGFEGPKKVAYMITAYKNPENANLKWEELEKMSTKELKKLSYTDKDLSFIDTQIQFYKQNAAAGSLIGVFAVNKVAHATLEGDDIWIAVNELCDTSNYFSIAGCKFGGRMQIDPKYDLDGNLIGKSLGSMVSASADAAKDPILNLMNINMVTSGTFNTLLRLGMPFRKAAMFLSQNVLEDVIREFNRTNLNNYSSLDDIINARIKKLAKEYKFSSDSEINTEDISESELREGLTSKEHAAIDYKVLIAYQRIKSLADAMRKPTFVTRFNSIQSAVGPLIIDNLILEHKMKEFNTSFSEQDSTGFYTADGIPVDIDDICADHPILKGFSSTVALAKGLFRDMPAGSNGFEETLNNLPGDISTKMFGDKKLLDDFSNFYQSYLLVQSGFINPTQLGSYIKNFPTWFVKENLKEKYKENALIQAIQINTSKKTGLSSLSINLTGMDEAVKENLRSAWIDLHKQDPKLSKMLFDYSFFVGGVGFSPKTFMALVPTYVKARLKAANGVSYVDTYRDFPVVPNKKLLIQQFICNNWNDNKLVPKKGDKNSHFKVDLKKGTLQVITKEDMDAVGGVSYMKTKDKGITYLWKLIDSSAQGYTYERIMPLGGNGEYLEMSTADITKPMMETTQTIDDIKESSLKEQAPAEDTNLTTTSATEESTEKLKNRAEMIDLIMKQNPKLTKAEAGNMFENIKKNPKLYKRFLPNVYKHKGLTLNEEEAVKKFTEMC